MSLKPKTILLFMVLLMFLNFVDNKIFSKGSFFTIEERITRNPGGGEPTLNVEESRRKIVTSVKFHGCSLDDSCTKVKRLKRIRKSSCEVSMVFWKKITSNQDQIEFSDCTKLYEWGNTKSGVYEIQPGGPLRGKTKVYCKMEEDTGGWTVIQRRINEEVYFNRDWNDFKSGFGNLEGNMWIGLENLHLIAGPERRAVLQIRFKIKGYNETVLANYERFIVENEVNGYLLGIGGFSGNVEDAMSKQDRMMFSTSNKDQDICLWNCASLYSGGWWFGNCTGGPHANLNGAYPEDGITEQKQEILWGKPDKSKGKITYVEMKIKHRYD